MTANHTYRIAFNALSLCTVLLLMISCRKGDEDPYLSLRSRKNRLCKKWRVTQYQENTREIQLTDSTYKLPAYQNVETFIEYNSASGHFSRRISSVQMDTTYDSALDHYEFDSAVSHTSIDDFGWLAGVTTHYITTVKAADNEVVLSDITKENINGQIAYAMDYNITFEKEGTFLLEITMEEMQNIRRTSSNLTVQLEDNRVEKAQTYSGKWEFLKSNSEFKNKERVGLWIDDNTYQWQLSGTRETANDDPSGNTYLPSTFPVDYTITETRETNFNGLPDITLELVRLSNDEMEIRYETDWESKVTRYTERTVGYTDYYEVIDINGNSEFQVSLVSE